MENLVYWAKLYGLNNQKAYKNAVDVIKKVKLFKWADTEVSKYSHGMKKRYTKPNNYKINCYYLKKINNCLLLQYDRFLWILVTNLSFF